VNEPEKSLANKVLAFIADRLATKLEAFDKASEKKRNDTLAGQLNEVEDALRRDRATLIGQYRPESWLTDAARRAGQINMVTHAPKYTHSDTRSAGVLLRQEDKDKFTQNECYVNSLALADLRVDVVGNAAALDVARLLQLEWKGKALLDEIAAGESPALNALAANDEQASAWVQGFQAALKDKALASGQLAKQLYFPTSDSYHLISPLYASSLSQNLYERLTASFYSENTKSIRQARKAGKYHPDDLVVYLNVAMQSFGGTKPQNISQLNTKRYGRGFLLSSQPPKWDPKAVVPKGGKNAFWREYDRRAWKTAKFLQRHLESTFKRTSTRELRDRRAGLIDELVDTLFIYAAEIQRQVKQRGWSTESELSSAEKLWLDPQRGELDDAFKAEREKNEWQGEIARQFAAWLNQKINFKSDVLHTSDAEFREWQKLLEKKLLLLKDDLEVAV